MDVLWLVMAGIVVVGFGALYSSYTHHGRVHGVKADIVPPYSIDRLSKQLAPTECSFTLYIELPTGIVPVGGVYTAQYEGRRVMILERAHAETE